jgi:hypothetical protein
MEFRYKDYISLDVQGYYKYLFNQSRLVLTSNLGSDVSDFNIPGATTRYSSAGFGRAYGMDTMLRYKYAGLNGWIAYSLAKYERDAFVGTGYVPGQLDQPHNLIIVASYTFPLAITLGTRFRFTSGPRYTRVIASMYDINGNYYYPLPGLPWGEVLPNFYQLDVRLDKRFTFRDFSLVVYADVQNVLNTRNAEGLFYNYNYTQKAFVYGLPILPTVGLRGEW